MCIRIGVLCAALSLAVPLLVACAKRDVGGDVKAAEPGAAERVRPTGAEANAGQTEPATKQYDGEWEVVSTPATTMLAGFTVGDGAITSRTVSMSDTPPKNPNELAMAVTYRRPPEPGEAIRADGTFAYGKEDDLATLEGVFISETEAKGTCTGSDGSKSTWTAKKTGVRG